MHASGQLGVRICMLLLFVLVFAAVELGQDLILGAFAAGLVLGFVTRDAPALDDLWHKLDAIGYGLLIPFFFIRSGMTFDLDGLLESPASVAELPLFLAPSSWCAGCPHSSAAARCRRARWPARADGGERAPWSSPSPTSGCRRPAGVRHGGVDGRCGDAVRAHLPGAGARPAEAGRGEGDRGRPAPAGGGPGPAPPA